MCFFFLAVPHILWDLSSPTRDWTWALGSVSAESQPLDRQGIPLTLLFIFLFLFFLWENGHFYFILFFQFNLIFFYTAGSYQLFILYILVYICQSQSPSSSHFLKQYNQGCVEMILPVYQQVLSQEPSTEAQDRIRTILIVAQICIILWSWQNATAALAMRKILRSLHL